MKRILLCVIIFNILFSCRTNLPITDDFHYGVFLTRKIKNDTMYLTFDNLLKCPARLVFDDEKLQSLFVRGNATVLPPFKDTKVKISMKDIATVNFNHKILYGDLNNKVRLVKFGLPFLGNRTYKIEQGYNGKYSHSTAGKEYALDINLSVGDTVCAAYDGVVVYVEKKYEKSGTTKKWIPLSNQIILYHPSCGLFSNYSHLKKNSVFVEEGDSVKIGQPIGLVGMTGFTSGPHLHFEVSKPSENGLQTVMTEFIEPYIGVYLKKGDEVRKGHN